MKRRLCSLLVVMCVVHWSVDVSSYPQYQFKQGGRSARTRAILPGLVPVSGEIGHGSQPKPEEGSHTTAGEVAGSHATAEEEHKPVEGSDATGVADPRTPPEESHVQPVEGSHATRVEEDTEKPPEVSTEGEKEHKQPTTSQKPRKSHQDPSASVSRDEESGRHARPRSPHKPRFRQRPRPRSPQGHSSRNALDEEEVEESGAQGHPNGESGAQAHPNGEDPERPQGSESGGSNRQPSSPHESGVSHDGSRSEHGEADNLVSEEQSGSVVENSGDNEHGSTQDSISNTQEPQLQRKNKQLDFGTDKPPPSPFCLERRDGNYGIPEHECSFLYYSCSGGSRFIRHCSSETLRFDALSGHCLGPDYVEACGGTATTTTTTTTMSPEEQSKQTLMVTDSGVNCMKLEDGAYADVRRPCSKFFVQCSNGQVIPLQCAAEMRFDLVSRKCLEPDYVESCGGESTTSHPFKPLPVPQIDFDCLTRDDGDYVKEDDRCSSVFYSCVDGQGYQRYCREGLNYDVWSGQCLEVKYVKDCGGIATTPPTFGQHEIPQMTGKGVQCAQLPDGLYPDGRDSCSSEFVSCVSHFAIPSVCARENLRFDVETNQCRQPQFITACGGTPTTTVPYVGRGGEEKTQVMFDCSDKEDGNYESPDVCSREFFSCSGGTATKNMCSEFGLRFDRIADDCLGIPFVESCGGTATTTPAPTTTTTEKHVKEESTTTEPPLDLKLDCWLKEDGFYPDNRRGMQCSVHFAACVGGAPSNMICPSTLRFDPAVKNCLSPAHITACGGTPPTTPGPDDEAKKSRW